MIRLSIGNVGSGKTVCEVREMVINQAKIKYYTNIKTTLDYQIDIDGSMICSKEEIGVVKSTGELKYKFTLNQDYWRNIKEPITVILDEAHSILNARKFNNKVNIVVTDWIALLRRVLGEDSRGAGDLVLITQLPGRVDVIAREMATQVKYHICHYVKACGDCGASWREHSDMPELMKNCIRCNSINIKKHSHVIEIKAYPSMDAYTAHKVFGENSHYDHYYINDIGKYFPYYDTLQWDNMFSNLYE